MSENLIFQLNNETTLYSSANKCAVPANISWGYATLGGLIGLSIGDLSKGVVGIVAGTNWYSTTYAIIGGIFGGTPGAAIGAIYGLYNYADELNEAAICLSGSFQTPASTKKSANIQTHNSDGSRFIIFGNDKSFKEEDCYIRFGTNEMPKEEDSYIHFGKNEMFKEEDCYIRFGREYEEG